MSGPPPPAPARWQVVGITAAALAAWLAVRLLSSPPAWSPMDFVVGGADALQFCDPNHPRFLPVVTRSLPVTLRISPPGRQLVLTTVTGKPLGLRDLVPTDGVPLRLFIVNRALTQFCTADPRPGRRRGEWVLAFDPPSPDPFRVFADFTPAALGREIYATADLDAAGMADGGRVRAAVPEAGWRFDLESAPARIYALQPITLTLAIDRPDGAPVALTPLGGVRGHLVAFDRACTGMVHLRSLETTASPAGTTRALATFQVTFPDSGAYVLWAQLVLNGRTVLERFDRDVAP